MKTILLISACYDEPHRTMGSAPKIARQLAKKAKVVVFAGGSSDRVEKRSKNLTVHFVKEWLIPDPVNNGVVPLMCWKIGKVLKQYDFDAVLNLKYMFYPNLLGPYLKMRGYRVVTVTDAFPGFSWFAKSWYVNAVMWMYTRTLGMLVLKTSDKVVLFHEGIRKDAERLKLDYQIIPNGVEPEVVKKGTKKTLAGRINVLYVGRLESVKGYQTIIEAMQRVTDEHKDVHFYHIGHDGGNSEYVKEHAGERMHFVGRVPLHEVYAHMKGADIVLLASRSEGLPNVIMEGMYCGCVPVSTPVGAVPWLLDEGKLGRMFEYQDTEGLVKEVEWLIEHPKERKQMAAAGKKKMRTEFSYPKLAERYLEVLCAE